MANTSTKAEPFVNPLVTSERPETLPSNRSLTVVRSHGNPIPEFRREIISGSYYATYRFEKICDIVAEALEAAVKSSPELSHHCLWGTKIFFGSHSSSVELVPLVQGFETGWFGFGRTKTVFSEISRMARITIIHEHGKECGPCPCTCGREETHALSSWFENPDMQESFVSALTSARKKELLKYAIDTHTYNDVRTGKRQNDQFKR